MGSALDIIDDSENIHVICHDLTEGSIHLLQTQVVDFVLGQEPVNQGYLLIKTLFEYLVKNITPHKTSTFRSQFPPMNLTKKKNLKTDVFSFTF